MQLFLINLLVLFFTVTCFGNSCFHHQVIILYIYIRKTTQLQYLFSM
jgi:hypothetical protein